MRIPRNAVLSLLAAFALSVLVCFNNLSNAPKNIISWDVYGYYLYLPQIFIQHDLKLKDTKPTLELMQKYKSSATFYQASLLENGNHVLKYTAGMAVVYAPFFFVGHGMALSRGEPADGYSAPYQTMMLWGAIFYAVLGLWLMRAVFRRLFPDWVAMVLLVILVLGSNYYVHVTSKGAGAMSHNFLLTGYAAVLLLTLRWHEGRKWWDALLLGIVCGVMILSRPTEIVCVLIPLLWGLKGPQDLGERVSFLLSHWRHLALVTGTIVVIGGIQLVYWRYVAGTWIVDSYGGNPGEGLDLHRPHLWEVLFSFRKGWLIYTPVMGLALLGMVQLWRRQREIFWAVGLYFVLNLYLVSSWSTWWYAQSFGQRALIPSYAVLALPLGYLIWEAARWRIVVKVGLAGLVVALIGLNLFQSWQYQQYILSSDRMTWEYYKRIFLRTEADYEDYPHLLVERSSEGVERPDYLRHFYEVQPMGIYHDYEDSLRFDDSLAHGGLRSDRLGPDREYGAEVKMPYHRLTTKDHAWLKISAYVYATVDPKEAPFSLVVHFMHDNQPYKYVTFYSSDAPVVAGQWSRMEFYYLTPEVRDPKDELKIYVWNMNKQLMFVDDLKVDIYEKVR